MTDRGDRKDRGGYGYRDKQSSNQKEKMPFRCSHDSKKWCEIHCTLGHDLEECKTFLDRKKMPPPIVSAPQDAQGEHR
jgi:hypothetical protein